METVSQMLKSSPERSFTNATDILTECIRACLDCEQASTACIDACLDHKQLESLRQCIRACLDCTDACGCTCRMLSRHHEADVELLKRQMQAVVLACRVCAEECERHQALAFCRICMECCRRCETACTSLLQVMSVRSPSSAH